MPQLNGGGGDDLGANDEMIPFKDEEDHEKIRESAFTESDLADLKSSLVNESEISQNSNSAVIRRGQQEDQRIYTDKREHLDDVPRHQDGGMYKAPYSGYPFLMLPEPYLPNGPVSPSSNKVSVVQQGMHPLTPLLPYDHFNPSPPHIPTDVSQKPGVHRHQSQEISGFYSLPQGQITPSMNWPNQPVYPLPSCGFRQSFSSSLQSSSSFPRFSHSLMLQSGMHPTGIPHPAIVPPSGKQEHDQFDRSIYTSSRANYLLFGPVRSGIAFKSHAELKREKEPKKPVIKKPLNAFMLYMKEMRAKVIAECTLKESAAINQILGRRWHALTREEQAKYYELARKERQLHMQLYPSWSARDNYITLLTVPRRKKKCIRYLQRGRCASPHSSDGSAIDSSPSPVNHPPNPASPTSSPLPQSAKRSAHPPRLSLDFSRITTESAVRQPQ
uniref:HMG box domain-containing protein n=1 Tax=Sinocyclocheilus anshuiensis TaxID=1608454 RepID=A0A671SGY1_9TELE